MAVYDYANTILVDHNPELLLFKTNNICNIIGDEYSIQIIVSKI